VWRLAAAAAILVLVGFVALGTKPPLPFSFRFVGNGTQVETKLAMSLNSKAFIYKTPVDKDDVHFGKHFSECFFAGAFPKHVNASFVVNGIGGISSRDRSTTFLCARAFNAHIVWGPLELCVWVSKNFNFLTHVDCGFSTHIPIKHDWPCKSVIPRQRINANSVGGNPSALAGNQGISHQIRLIAHETSGGGGGQESRKVNPQYGLVVPIAFWFVSLLAAITGSLPFLNSSLRSPLHFFTSFLILAAGFYGMAGAVFWALLILWPA
jgi:hypothetical protein